MIRSHARAVLIAATALSSMSAAAYSATLEEGAEALRQVIANPSAPTPAVLSTFSFSDSQYVVDELTTTERYRLQDLIYDYGVKLPGGIDTAIRAKAPRNVSSRD